MTTSILCSKMCPTENPLYIDNMSILYLGKMMSEQLKEWRRGHNISQAGLAELLGIDVMTISRWERGIINIPPFLHLALRCLDIEGGELLKRAQRKRKERDRSGKRDL